MSIFHRNFFLLYIYTCVIGAAYLPLDVAYPQSMLKSVLEDAKPTAVITVKELADSLKGNKLKKVTFER